MTESQAAVAEQEEAEFLYPVTVEDAGVATKKVTVTIPADRITQSIDTQFKDLRSSAALPGFRPGRVPQKLIEKKFTKDVRDQVTQTLLRESYQQAVEKNKLQVLGEPSFENEEGIKLPEGGGDLSYTFSVEVQPDFALPELSGITIKKPKIEVKDEHVEQALKNLREQQGTLLPVEDRGVAEGDAVEADIVIKNGDEELVHQPQFQFYARKPMTLLALQFDDLPATLAGAKPGETRTATAVAPETHQREDLRGKELTVEFKINDIRQLELAEINAEFLQQLGFENEEELNKALREEMENRVKNDVQNAMRDQVAKALLEATQFELPSKLSKNQEMRIVQRRAMDLVQRGVPEEQIGANIEMLKGGASDEAARELKLFFILGKVAESMEIEVSNGELNGNIAAIAEQRGLRPEKLRQQMQQEGTLSNLYLRLRELKAIDKILEKATIEEVEPDALKA
ncbi:MAG TPA: trigger factor [Tepidisphaeraceae bacterium]|jgi:trigger factor